MEFRIRPGSGEEPPDEPTDNPGTGESPAETVESTGPVERPGPVLSELDLLRLETGEDFETYFPEEEVDEAEEDPEAWDRAAIELELSAYEGLDLREWAEVDEEEEPGTQLEALDVPAPAEPAPSISDYWWDEAGVEDPERPGEEVLPSPRDELDTRSEVTELAEVAPPESADRPRLLDDDELQELGRRLVDVIDPDRWREADIPERMLLAQRAHAAIREAYGLPAIPLLYDMGLPPQVAGRFDASTGQVSINANLLDDDLPGELLDTLAHENHHAVQTSLVDELGDTGPGVAATPQEWSAARRWASAWNEYDLNDTRAYFNNAMEKDARRAGLQVAGNGYWRAYVERMATSEQP
jgi:hypothetical protein